MSKHRLSVLWADDKLTILDMPSKAAAINWLATHDTDRPILTASIIPVADDDVIEGDDDDPSPVGRPTGDGFPVYCNTCGGRDGRHSYHCHNDR